MQQQDSLVPDSKQNRKSLEGRKSFEKPLKSPDKSKRDYTPMNGELPRNTEYINGFKEHNSIDYEKEIKKLQSEISQLQNTHALDHEITQKTITTLTDEKNRLVRQHQEDVFTTNEMTAKARRLEQQLAEEQLHNSPLQAPQTPRTPRTLTTQHSERKTKASLLKELEMVIRPNTGGDTHRLEEELQEERHERQQLETELRIWKEKVLVALDTLDLDGHSELMELKEVLSKDKSLRRLEGSDAERMARLEQRNQELEAELARTQASCFSWFRKSSLGKKKKAVTKKARVVVPKLPENMGISLLDNVE